MMTGSNTNPSPKLMVPATPALRVARRAAALAVVVSIAGAVAATPADARDRYTDAEGSNPVRLVSYVVHPVGKIAEWVVFRPIHAVGQYLAPDRRQHTDNVAHCRTYVPSRRCTPYFR